ncbi:TetR/AcrR family transcriptional regulator [Pengzhenrongella sicca]|uniref:TetR/AcrR family transcriptional regulator n=2 Tax=Pengzhenrongella sicca TaxID=2819238 RepID=A0A8A4ZH37_9MICO|nr:TetR/AcrR family transcriptional regulator [Pengzhenrongella sicca]
MTAHERREQILHAARSAFADGGYAATTTDQVARAAGVSQPYVVRLFGGKQQLFVEVYTRACTQIVDTLAAVPAGPEAKARMGDAYIGLLTDHDLLRLVLHGFAAGSDPEIGRLARATLSDAFRLYRERTGEGPDEARVFVAHGMLISVLLAVDAAEHLGESAALAALAECTFGDALGAASVGATSVGAASVGATGAHAAVSR